MQTQGKFDLFKNKFLSFSKEYGIFYALLIVLVIMSIFAKSFFSLENILNIFSQSAVFGILAAGEFFVIIAGKIDLSVGSILALAGVIFAVLVKALGIVYLPLAILCAILAGVIIGLLNGLLVSFMRIPPFITTLGTMLIVRGLVHAVTGSYPIAGLPDGIEYMGRGNLAGIPVSVCIMVVIFIIITILAEKKKTGRYLYAIGGNEDAARLSGIDVNKYVTIAYVLCGILSAISGFLLVSRLTSGQPKAGEGYEFEAIIAVIIGGVSFSGGKGKAMSVLFGAIFVSALMTGLRILNLDSNIQTIIKGAVFIIAIGLDVWRNKKV